MSPTALLALLLLAQSPVPDGPASTHVIEAGEAIGPVLLRAAPGDTIRLSPGEYRENLVITVPVVLIGPAELNEQVTHTDTPEPARPIIRGGYEGHVIHILAPGTVVDGIHVSEAGPQLTKDYAAILVEANSVEIRNCVITEPLHGIYVKAGIGTVIEDNHISGRIDLIESDRGNGIHLWKRGMWPVPL